MRAHIIENGVVVNTIVVESLDVLPNLISAENGGKKGDLWNGSGFATPIRTPTREEKKSARAAAVSVITVTTTAGNTFDGNEESQTRMTRAIIGMTATNTATINWVLADNTVIQATVAELTEALALAGAAQAALWVIE